MADNTQLNAGSGGDLIATDEIGGVKHQRVKVQHGADGAATDVSAASPLPVDVRADNAGGLEVVQNTAADLNVTEASAAAIKTAVELIDDWDETDRAKVNPIVGQAGIAAGAGAVGMTVPRVTLASDDPGVSLLTTIDADTSKIPSQGNAAMAASTPVTLASDDTLATAIKTAAEAIQAAVELIDNCISGNEAQVDVIAALPAGSNAIGKLAANSGVDIGDVDVTSIAAGTNTIGGVIGQPSTTAAYDGTTACTVKEFMVVGTTAGNNTLVAAVAAKKIRLLHLEIIALSATANTVYLVNADYDLVANSSNPIPLAADADGDNHAGFITGPGFRRTTDTVNEAVIAVQSATAPILYMGTYIEID